MGTAGEKKFCILCGFAFYQKALGSAEPQLRWGEKAGHSFTSANTSHLSQHIIYWVLYIEWLMLVSENRTMRENEKGCNGVITRIVKSTNLAQLVKALKELSYRIVHKFLDSLALHLSFHIMLFLIPS